MTATIDFGMIPGKATRSFDSFKVAITEEQLGSLRTLLNTCPVAGRTYESTWEDGSLGISHQWLAHTVDHWRSSFDWRKHEAHMNTFPHYQTTITDDDDRQYRMHFVGMFSQRSDATPIFLLHGWPGSFLEFLPMLDVLRKKYTPKDLPYHLIVPSLPGYTFSSPPPLDRDFRVEDMARIIAKLAVSLGFGNGFVVQGGDVGSKVARVIAAKHEECKVNFCIMPEPSRITLSRNGNYPISTPELIGLARAHEFDRTGSAYALEHATRPNTIGFALASSPIALLSW
ncbi:MAG: hypothetical protein Q9160_004544 [Pyrenula sp. 1 TL-2023]